MTIPNDAAKTEQAAEQEPEGIRRMREDYSPEKVEEILGSVRKAADSPDNGEWMSLAEFMERHGIKPEDVRL